MFRIGAWKDGYLFNGKSAKETANDLVAEISERGTKAEIRFCDEMWEIWIEDKSEGREQHA